MINLIFYADFLNSGNDAKQCQLCFDPIGIRIVRKRSGLKYVNSRRINGTLLNIRSGKFLFLGNNDFEIWQHLVKLEAGFRLGI